MNFKFLKRSRRDSDLEDEIQGHLRMAAQDRIDRGETREQAEASARRETGNVGLIKEVTREMWGWTSLERLLQDLRFGTRMLRKNPGSTFVSLLTLALGVGASTAIFSVVYGVLLRPLPYDKPEQIVRVWEVDGKGRQMRFADPNFDDVREQNRTLEGIAEFGSGLESVSAGSGARRVNVAEVSRDFLAVMGVQPVMGRGFTAEDQKQGVAPAALVSYAYWKQNLNRAVDLASVRLVVGNQSATVVGVLPPGFRFPDSSDVWFPREVEQRLPSRTAHNWSVLGRLRDGVSLAQARSDVSAIGRRLKQQYGQDITLVDIGVSPLREALTSSVRLPLLILLNAVGFLLLVACANVMNLLLAQAAAREGELAVRSALGASRARLVRQFLVEGLLLSLIGGTIGVLAAYGGVHVLLAIAPPDLPRLDEVSVNLPVLLFALGLSMGVATVLGIFTAWRACTADPRNALAEGGRGQAGASGASRLGRAIISAQVATTLVLLVGAGLLGRSLLRLLSIDPGFRTAHIVTMDLVLGSLDDLALASPSSDADKMQRSQFLNELFNRLRALPGVREVGGTTNLPLTTGLYGGTYVLLNPAEPLPKMEELDQLFHDHSRTGYADYCVASEGYFRVLGIPLVAGRLFDDRDMPDEPHAAIVSQSLAREKWPGQEALGHVIEFGNMDGDMRPLTVVGVVGDVRANTLERPPRPIIYLDYRQRPKKTESFTVVMRTDAAAAGIVPEARRVLHDLDPGVPPSFNTFTDVFAASLSARRFNLILVGIFAGTALLLAVAGIYGVLAYSVARRTREIGVRIALGASSGNVLGLVLRQAMVTATAGVAAGIVGSFVLTRLMQSLLFEISPTDPLTFAGVTLVLLLVAAVASYLPARRAAKVDPIIALRYE
jgi:putative ABC transport system permease protein